MSRFDLLEFVKNKPFLGYLRPCKRLRSILRQILKKYRLVLAFDISKIGPPFIRNASRKIRSRDRFCRKIFELGFQIKILTPILHAKNVKTTFFSVKFTVESNRPVFKDPKPVDMPPP